MKQWTEILLTILLISLSVVSASAVETAPRISDREIVEALAILKQGQVDINRRLDDLTSHTNQRLDDVNRRFDDVNQRFDDINRRFDDVNHRIDGLQNTMLVLFGAIITLIVALFGYIVWDRRTALRPLQDRLERLERDLQRDLELQHEEGSRLTRLVKALREMAKTDENIAEVLRSFSLL